MLALWLLPILISSTTSFSPSGIFEIPPDSTPDSTEADFCAYFAVRIKNSLNVKHNCFFMKECTDEEKNSTGVLSRSEITRVNALCAMYWRPTVDDSFSCGLLTYDAIHLESIKEDIIHLCNHHKNYECTDDQLMSRGITQEQSDQFKSKCSFLNSSGGISLMLFGVLIFAKLYFI